MKKQIHGTYWLVNSRGRKWITQGEMPTRSGSGFNRHGPGMGWVVPGASMWSPDGHGGLVNGADFAGIELPDIDEDDPPMEIEISKSGRVYTYA